MSVVTTEMQDQVTELYITYFGRAPDAEGFGFWTQALANGASVLEIGNDFAKSPEFVEAYGGLTPEQQVNRFYQNTLDRDADPGGLAYWSGLLVDGASFSSVAYAIVNAAFTGGDGIAESDTSLVRNKVEVGKFFAIELQSNDFEAASGAFETVTSDEASVAATEARLTEEVAGGSLVNLTTGLDVLDGNTANNTFVARVVQNQNGEQTNQLGTGDQLNGGDGTDTLNAKVITASPLNAGPFMPIAPETVGVDVANFTALAALRFEAEEVEINAQFMNGLDRISSANSDASLLVTNVNTLTDDGVYANKRLTSDVTIRMDHSGNDETYSESNMTVLFDNNYLLDSRVDTSALRIDMVNNVPLANLDTPLAGFESVSFNVGDRLVEVAVSPEMQAATGIEAYRLLTEGIEAELVSLGIVNVDVELLPAEITEFSIDIAGFSRGEEAGTYSPIQVLSNGGGALSTGNVRIASDTVDFNGANTEVLDEPGSLDIPVTSNIELLKVGRGSDGGALTVGGMATDFDNEWDFSSAPTLQEGVEQFNVEVFGDASQFSSLSSLQSTNNTLQTVVVTSAAGSEADLIIGNLNTQGGVPNVGPLNASGNGSTGPTTNINNALKDVRNFDSTVFANDVEVHGYLSPEVVAKYMDLTDDAADPAADNVQFTYSFGAGDDTLNLNIAKENLAFQGAATREDFTFAVNGASGNDTILLQIGDSEAGEDAHWFINTVQNGNLSVDGGVGDDLILTYGSGAFLIDGNTGNDAIYTDNSGVQAFVPSGQTVEENTFNDGRATWVVNATETGNNIYDLESLPRTDTVTNAAETTVTVSFLGYGVDGIVAGTSDDEGGILNDLTVNQTIKNIINNDEYLSDMLVAEDGPSGTLVIRSLIDGERVTGDLSIAIGSELNASQQAFTGDKAEVPGDLIQTMTGRLGGVQYAGESDSGPSLVGADANGLNQNTVIDGLGADTIVLSTSELAQETVELVADGTVDIIVNFDEERGDTLTVGGATPDIDPLLGSNPTVFEVRVDGDLEAYILNGNFVS